MFVILYSLYLYTSILAPITTIEITAQFLSLLFNDYTNLFNSVILVINFIVLYILVGVQATMELVVPVNKQNALDMRVSAGLLTNETIRQQQHTSTVEDGEELTPVFFDEIKGMCPQNDDKETTAIVNQQAESDHNSLIEPISASIDQEHKDTLIADVSQEQQDTTTLSVENAASQEEHIVTHSIEDNSTTKYEFLKDDPSSYHADTPDLSPPNQSTSSSISSTSSKPKHQSMIITDSMISFNSSKKVNFFSSVRLKRKSKEIQETKPKPKKSSSSKFTKKLSKLFKV